jgi:hypothetical protein
VVRPKGAVRPLRDRSKSGVLTGRRTIRAISLVALSLVSACLVLVMPLLGFMLWSLRRSDIVVAYGRIDPGLLGPGLPRVIGSIPLPLLTVDCFVIAAAAAITVPVSYLAARRIATLTADELSRGKDEPQILYLRNFADDDIRMPTSRLSRNSLIERIAVYRLERFEEVLVRHLSHFAPVIAVDPAGIRKKPIGAARMTLTDKEWQGNVQSYIDQAMMIVVGAAPQRRTDGLSWELAQIAGKEALPRTLLLLPPLPASAVRARWEVFASMATSYLLPPDLTPCADHHLVLAAVGPGRWRTWYSRRRTEWDYMAALGQAVQEIFRPGNAPASRAAPPGSTRACSPDDGDRAGSGLM